MLCSWEKIVYLIKPVHLYQTIPTVPPDAVRMYVFDFSMSRLRVSAVLFALTEPMEGTSLNLGTLSTVVVRCVTPLWAGRGSLGASI